MAADSPADTRVSETLSQAEKRWRREGRDLEVAVFRGRIRDECRESGMTRREAHDHAWEAALAAFPPEGQEATSPEPPDLYRRAQFAPSTPSSGAQPGGEARIRGLADIPAEWPDLPANASLQAEVGWVQSERLYIVEELASGAIRVHLDRAHESAPSRAALGWLETSIRSYAKFVEVAAKCLAQQVDAQEAVHRERMAIEEIRGLLREMRRHKGEKTLSE
jgi:hypothetical protein